MDDGPGARRRSIVDRGIVDPAERARTIGAASPAAFERRHSPREDGRGFGAESGRRFLLDQRVEAAAGVEDGVADDRGDPAGAS